MQHLGVRLQEQTGEAVLGAEERVYVAYATLLMVSGGVGACKRGMPCTQEGACKRRHLHSASSLHGRAVEGPLSFRLAPSMPAMRVGLQVLAEREVPGMGWAVAPPTSATLHRSLADSLAAFEHCRRVPNLQLNERCEKGAWVTSVVCGAFYMPLST